MSIYSKFSWASLLLVTWTLGSCANGPGRNIASTPDTIQVIATKVLNTPLIPRDVLLAPGARMRVRLSPDGTALSSVQPIVRNGKNYYGVFIRSIGVADAPENQVLPEPIERFPMYTWSLKPGWMAYTRDIGGNENDQLFILDTDKKTETNVTNNPNVKVRSVGVHPKFPNLILFQDNSRDPKVFDLFAYDLEARAKKPLYENKESFLAVILNDELKPRLAYKYNASGGMDLSIFEGAGWKNLFSVPFEFVPGFDLISYDAKADVLYFIDGSKSDLGRIVALNLKTKKRRILASPARAQITESIKRFDGSGMPLAYATEYLKTEYFALDKKFEPELEALKSQLPDGTVFQLMSQTQDDKTWLLAVQSDQKSIHYHIWDRAQKSLKFLLAMNPAVDALPLVPMHPVVIKSRDGLDMVSYITLPPGYSWDAKSEAIAGGEGPLPMILNVHGGPWARDSWGLNTDHQLYANRGYVVLSVNYRGSTGFGRTFESKSFGEWGRKMHDDLIDAVQWAINKKIARTDKVAISGASYGGYATLAGLTFTPTVFSSGVNSVGVANLITMEESIPDYWKPFKENSKRRMGASIETKEGRDFLWSRSPLSKVEQIQRPLLVGHGDNDPRVKLAEALQITEAMVKKNLPVTLIRFPDEGHGFARPENRKAFEAISEVFLSRQNSGRYEKLRIPETSSIHAAQGANLIDGLCEELRRLKKTNHDCP